MTELSNKPEAFRSGNCNNHRCQCHQNNYQQDWCHKNAWSVQSPSLFPRGHSIPSTSDSYGFYKMSNDTEVDEYNCQHNGQNKSYHCGACYCAQTDSARKRNQRIPERRGASSHEERNESNSATDSTFYCNLQDIYDKMLRVAAWGRKRSLSAGFEPLCGIQRNPCPPVLAPQKEPPHTRNLCRVKPYKRHQMYQRMWKEQPAIGDNFRYSLRQKVRQKMLRKDEAQLPHKVFVPNMYVVPSVKPRYNLRWVVRKCNHDYRMPPTGSFYDI